MVSGRKALRWSALAAGALLTICFFILLVFYFLLKSSAITQQSVAGIAPYLQPLGIELRKVESAHIDLLDSIRIRNLELDWHDPERGTVSLVAGVIDLDFSPLALLHDELKIAAVRVADVSLTGDLRLPPPAAPPPAAPADTNLWQQLEQALAPPLALSLQSVTLDNIKLDLRLEQAQQYLQYRGVLSHLATQLQWHAADLHGRLDLDLGQAADAGLRLGQSDGTELRLRPQWRLGAQGSLQRQADGWRVQDAAVDNSASLSQLTLVKKQNGSEQILAALDALVLQVKAAAKSAQRRAGGNQPFFVFPLDVTGAVQTSVRSLQLQDLALDGVLLSGQGDDELQLNFAGVVEPAGPVRQLRELSLTHKLHFSTLHLQDAQQRVRLSDLRFNATARGQPVNDSQGFLPVAINASIDAGAKQVQASAVSGAQAGAAVAASLRPELRLQTSAQVNSLDTLYPTLGLALQGEVNLQQVALAEVKQAFSLRTTLQADKDTGSTTTRAMLRSLLDGKSLLTVDLQTSEDAGELRVTHRLQADVPIHAARYLPAAQALTVLGQPRVTWSGRLQLAPASQQSLQADGELELAQLHAPAVADGIVLSQPLTASYTVTRAQDYRVQLGLRAPGVLTAGLDKPLPLRADLQAGFTWPLTETTASGVIDVADRQALRYELSCSDQPQQAQLDTRWSLHVWPEWGQYQGALAALDPLGALASDLQLAVRLQHPQPSLQSLTTADTQAMQADVKLQAQLHQERGGTLLQLPRPAQLQASLAWAEQAVTADGRLDLPRLALAEQLALEDIALDVKAATRPAQAPRQATLELALAPGKVLLPVAGGETLDVGPLATPLRLSIAARQEPQSLLLENLNLQAGAKLLTLEAQGSASLDGKNAQLTSVLGLHLRDNLLVRPAVSGSGVVNIPWRLNLFNGDHLSLDGELQFTAVTLTTPQFAVAGVSGKFSFEEELLRSAQGKSGFRYVIPVDPFARVDFTRVQPYLNTPVLSLERVAVADKTVGPGQFALSIKQNLLQLQHFDLDLFGGHMAGQIYLDTTAGNWKLGLLSRLTDIDSRQLLAADSSGRKSEVAPVNARAALELDVRQRLLQGRLDITRIGRVQLLHLLELVDPEYKDEQLASVRTALQVANPTRVAVDMKRGLMDIDVALSGLPRPVQAKGLPLTPLLQNYAGDYFQLLEKIPLQ